VDTNLYYGTGGGGFSGTLTGAGGHDRNPLLAYCVDLFHDVGLGASYTNYAVQTAASYLDSTKAGELANLFTWAVADSSTWFSNKDKSSGVQLAVWEIVYDTGLDLSAGAFHTTSTEGGTNAAALGYAKDLLNHAGTAQANVLSVYILNSNDNQDQLFWEDASGHQFTSRTAVPEPTSLALTALALTGLALTRRRG
jgi:hypothetical protein